MELIGFWDLVSRIESLQHRVSKLRHDSTSASTERVRVTEDDEVRLSADGNNTRIIED